MPAGEAFNGRQQYDIEQAVADAEKLSGLTYSVYVGSADHELRPFAESLHAQLPDPRHTVLVVVDPAARLLEIVTGAEARRSLDDEGCRFAALAMQAQFAEGDLAGGIVVGLQRLGEHARPVAMLHTDEY